jgi:hydroxylamine dehydrogenase
VAAQYGEASLTPEQVAFSERYQPGGTRRAAHPLTPPEGASATTSGCAQCHAVGRPNDDGTIGTCTACHTRHTSSVAIARLPTTCGQCHMGPNLVILGLIGLWVLDRRLLGLEHDGPDPLIDRL